MERSFTLGPARLALGTGESVDGRLVVGKGRIERARDADRVAHVGRQPAVGVEHEDVDRVAPAAGGQHERLAGLDGIAHRQNAAEERLAGRRAQVKGGRHGPGVDHGERRPARGTGIDRAHRGGGRLVVVADDRETAVGREREPEGADARHGARAGRRNEAARRQHGVVGGPVEPAGG